MSERIPLADKVVLATNFLYRNYRTLAEGKVRNIDDTDGIRGDLGLQTIAGAIKLGVRIVGCDGGSSPDFLTAAERFTGRGFTLVTTETAGRAPQRRKAFQTATQLSPARAIVYLQAEKAPLLVHLGRIIAPILNEEAEIVIPAREDEPFKRTYPGYMWASEMRVNGTYNRIMKRYGFLAPNVNLDWFFGPVVFANTPEIATLFIKQYQIEGAIRTRLGASPNPEFHSGSHYFPLIEALIQRKRVMGIEIPFEYPRTQKVNEESPGRVAAFHQRRLLDASAYLTEAIHLLAFFKGHPESKIKTTQS